MKYVVYTEVDEEQGKSLWYYGTYDYDTALKTVRELNSEEGTSEYRKKMCSEEEAKHLDLKHVNLFFGVFNEQG